MPRNRRRRHAQMAIAQCYREWDAAVKLQRAIRRSQLLTAGFVIL